tara:strand:- start:35 stop:409 length:375 start_codon:yes stop_codon:yes gene_type:complete
MSFDFRMENYILKMIKIFFETFNINKSIFIIQSKLFNNILTKLESDNYPICSYENFDKFIEHNARILLLKDIDYPKLKLPYYNLHLKDNINLILFINTPKFIETNNYSLLLSTNDISKLNVFEI